MEQGRYIGNADYLGKGYAKEAALEWLNFGFNYLKLDKIVSIHKKENLIPQKINLNIGFKYFKSYDKYPIDNLLEKMITILQVEKPTANVNYQTPNNITVSIPRNRFLATVGTE